MDSPEPIQKPKLLPETTQALAYLIRWKHRLSRDPIDIKTRLSLIQNALHKEYDLDFEVYT